MAHIHIYIELNNPQALPLKNKLVMFLIKEITTQSLKDENTAHAKMVGRYPRTELSFYRSLRSDFKATNPVCITFIVLNMA